MSSGTFSLVLLVPRSLAQTHGEPHPVEAQANPNQQLQVNWLYGTYVPKDVALQSLSNHQRFSAFPAPELHYPRRVSDQAADSPPESGDGIGGYAKRTLRVMDNSSYGTPLQAWAIACLAMSLATIVVSARGVGRVRGMPLSVIS